MSLESLNKSCTFDWLMLDTAPVPYDVTADQKLSLDEIFTSYDNLLKRGFEPVMLQIRDPLRVAHLLREMGEPVTISYVDNRTVLIPVRPANNS